VTYGLEVRCSIQLSYGRTVYDGAVQYKSHQAASLNSYTLAPALSTALRRQPFQRASLWHSVRLARETSLKAIAP
jgi:hypothetical protein